MSKTVSKIIIQSSVSFVAKFIPEFSFMIYSADPHKSPDYSKASQTFQRAEQA